MSAVFQFMSYILSANERLATVYNTTPQTDEEANQTKVTTTVSDAEKSLKGSENLNLITCTFETAEDAKCPR